MKTLNKIKTFFETKTNEDKTLEQLIDEIKVSELTDIEIKKFVKKVLTSEDKTTENIHHLISKFNNVQIDNLNIHSYIIYNNKKLNFNLSPKQIMIILEKSDFSIKNNFINSYGESTLPMYVLANNKDQNLNLSPKQIMTIIKKSDFSIQNNIGFTIPTYIIHYNKTQNLNLTPKQITSIMGKANLSIKNNLIETIPTYLLKYNKNLNLSPNQIMSILEKADASLLNNKTITMFFNELKDNIDPTNKQLYKIVKSFNIKTKGISPVNQDQINKILFHYETEEKIQKKHKTTIITKL